MLIYLPSKSGKQTGVSVLERTGAIHHVKQVATNKQDKQQQIQSIYSLFVFIQTVC